MNENCDEPLLLYSPRKKERKLFFRPGDKGKGRSEPLQSARMPPFLKDGAALGLWDRSQNCVTTGEQVEQGL